MPEQGGDLLGNMKSREKALTLQDFAFEIFASSNGLGYSLIKKCPCLTLSNSDFPQSLYRLRLRP